MADKLFDDFIKNKLQNHSAPVPDDMWSRIIVETETEKPVALFGSKTLLSIFLLVTVSAIIGYLMWQTSGTNNIAKNIIQITPQSTLQQESFKENNNTGAEKDNLTATDNSDKNNIDKEENSKGEQQNVPHIPLKPEVNFKNKKTSIDLLSASSTNKEAVTVNNQTTNETNNYSLSAFNLRQQNILSITAKQERDFLINSNDLLNQLKLLNLSCIVDCPSAKAPGRNEWFFEIYGSPDYAKKTIEKNNSIDQNYFKSKDSTETMKAGFTAGVRVSKTINERMLIKSGLQYSQINEQFKYRTENERRLTTVVTIRTIVRAPGDTVRISDTSAIEQIGYRERITHNKYRSIDVPIILSYEWGDESWRKSINGGVLLNLRSWQQGEMLDTTYSPVAFNKATSQTFKKNVGVGIYLSFSLLRNISNKTDVFAEPYLRYNISNMTTDKGLFNQKFNVAGINLGIRHKLTAGRQHYYGR